MVPQPRLHTDGAFNKKTLFAEDKGMSLGHRSRKLLTFGLLCLPVLGWAQTIHYSYDADGRLIGKGPATAGLSVDGFSPGAGTPDMVVYIRGDGFDPVPAGNQVAFNGVVATVDRSSPSLIVAHVPTSATTGPVSVTTGGHTAASPASFVVLPAGFDPASYGGGSVIPLDDTFRTYGSLAGKRWGLTYAAASGGFISADIDLSQCSGITEAGLSYQLYGPAGQVLADGNLNTEAPTLLAPAAATAGTYVLFLSAPTAWTCPVAARVDQHVSPNDSPVHVVTSRPYQQKRLVFDYANAGAYGVASSALTTVPAGGALAMQFFGPTQTSAGLYYCGYSGYGECQGQLVYLPSGTYTAVLRPYDSRTQTIDSEFWLTDYIDGGSIEPGTTVHPVIEKPGQVVRYTFHGKQGDQPRLIETEKVLGPGGWYDVLTGRNPASECIFDNNYYCEIGGPTDPYDFAPLRYDGVYTLFYHLKSYGDQAPTGSATLTLSAPVQAQAPSSGGHADVSTSLNAQTVTMPFVVAANEDFSLSLTDVVSLPSPFYIKATVLRPDGSMLTWFDCGSYGGCYTTLQHAPPGQYTLVLERESDRTQTFSARVWRVPFVDGGTFAINSKRTVHDALPGQVTRFTVPGTAGQQLHFFMNNVALGSGSQSPFITGTNPDGGCFFDNNYYCSAGLGQNGSYDPEVLRLTGDYQLLVAIGSNGDQAPTGSMDLALSASTSITLNAGDDAHAIATTLSGQRADAFIAASAGDQFSLSLQDVASSTGRPVEADLYNPAGALLGYIYCGGYGGCAYTVRNADAGVYRLSFKAFDSDGATVSATLLKSIVVDAGLLVPGTPRVIAVNRPGNAVKLRVAGKAGESFQVSITNPLPDAHGTQASITGYGADNQCAFANNYYCSASSNGSPATIGPFAADGERDIYFYIDSKSDAAAAGSATVTLTPAN